MLYDISAVSVLQETEKALEKIERVLAFFEKQAEYMTFMWRHNSVTEDVLAALKPEIYTIYKAIVDRYKSDAWGIYEEELSYQEQVAIADAYYGDAGYVSRYAESLGKPVMLQKIGERRDYFGNPRLEIKKDTEGNYPFHIRAYEIVDDIMYFLPDEMNLLCSMNIRDGSIAVISSVPEEQMNQTGLFMELEYYKGRLILIPSIAKHFGCMRLQTEHGGK